MMRICLVEDEAYALKSLHQKIIDLNCSYEIVGTACNGLDALDVIAKTYPDVVITDIRMPDMDGITLIEHIHTHYTSIITIIISGYQDFKYAKKAIQYGVEDYLLKPVILNELRECLRKCEQTVISMRNRKQIDDVLSEIDPLRSQDMEYFLLYIIFGNAVSTPESIIHLNGFYIQSQAVESMFLHAIGSSGPAFCFIGVCSNEKVIIVPKRNITENTFVRELRDFAAALEREYNYSVTLSYRVIETIQQVDSYIHLCRTVAIQNVLPGINSIVSDALKTDYSTRNINNCVEYLAQSIRQVQLDALNLRIQSLFAEWMQNRYPLCAMQNDLIYITNSLKHSLLPTAQFEFTIVYYIENLVFVSNTYMDMSEHFYNLVVELFDLLVTVGGQAMSPTQLVDKIEQYFHGNLSNNLTLSMLSSEMNYSKVYLCRIFKKLKNTTPIDYFIQLKIERAKRLLHDYPSIPIKDIASSLGFNDVYYFSKVFKRITGQPPTAARKNCDYES